MSFRFENLHSYTRCLTFGSIFADIPLYEDDSDNILESDQIEDVGYDEYESDAGLSMLERLEKYCTNENMYTRQMVTRSLLETIRTIENEEEAEIFLKAISTLADDSEAMVRSELMEHIPHIGVFCLENLHIFGDPIPKHLLPIVVKYITDQNNQARKTSHAALLVLLEQGMIQRGDVECQVCPVILELAQPTSNDDFRTEAAALMCKLAPLIGKEATERLFLARFSNLCTDGLFHVRKVCATNFGDMCQVVGRKNTEEVLLNKFFYLCEDGVWGVRKACAECFMQVSCICSPEIRRTDLVEVFSNLICDQSRWVRMAAFQALGGFISTFADPSNTGLYVGDNGNLVVGKPEDFPREVRSDSSSNSSTCDTTNSEPTNAVSAITEVQSNESPSDSGNSVLSEDSSKEEGLVTGALLPSMTLVKDNGDEDAALALHQLHLNESVEETRAQSYNAAAGGLGSVGEVYADKLDPAVSDNVASPAAHISSSVPSNDPTCNVGKPDQEAASGVITDGKSANRMLMSHNSPANTNNMEFNNFQYWRMPIPEIDITMDQSECRRTADEAYCEEDFGLTVSEEESSNPHHRSLSDSKGGEVVDCEQAICEIGGHSQMDDGDVCGPIYTASVHTVCETVEEVANFGSTHVVGQHVSERAMAIKAGASDVPPPDDNEELGMMEDLLLTDQDVIPQMLLNHYLSMVDPSRAQTVDSEIARHCAYSFPAVAYTLGRKYWPCLKELYEKLAHDMQLKVRRTLAFSIHELAVILGEEITNRDLVPVFNYFLRDLDEVRVGVLKHLGDFLKLLKPDARQEYLTKIDKFLNTDNTRNWRFREELALQLGSLLELYSTKDISEYLVPVAILLTEDPVAALSAMVGCLNEYDDGNGDELASLIRDVKDRFALSSSSGKRQMFVYICHSILEHNSLTQEQFATDLLPVLLNLSEDAIPNVRIALSRTLAKYIMNSDFFTSVQNPVQAKLLDVIEMLKSDSEYDVRYFLVPTLRNTDIASDIVSIDVFS
ncbi:hypothetical protein LSH36_270g03036 [Paralvinella palmiformis]|uniref:Serine/threonine-protein phosphatase 4 regulatory subunit 1 n=1 Tax=Paralvinella palmiformis TaxID=53620 RepID=A0AAD9JJS4_9ANNE|nr:hypothetical protein LSH36_270g03036 [Paralvinella palmiformis]